MLTNRERLDKISNTELAQKIKSLKSIPCFEYIDWETWLQSYDENLPYIGEMCLFKPYEEAFAPSEWMSGIMVDKQIVSGTEYKVIVADNVRYLIPSNRVKYFGD